MVKNLLIAVVVGTIAIVFSELLVRVFVDVRNVGPSFTEFDPVYGKSLKKNFSAMRYTPEFTMRITTNSLGFRGPEPWGERPILFLGDSMTLGYGVNDGEEFPRLVEKKLGVPVINRGIGDSGQGFWIKFLEREATVFDPRLVVLQVLSNDYHDNIRENFFKLDDEQLREVPIPGPGFKRNAHALIELFPPLSYSHLLGLARQIDLRNLRAAAAQQPRKQVNSRADMLTLSLLDRAIALCRERGWPFLLVILVPDKARYAQLQSLGPHVRLPSKDQRPDLYYRIDGHFNAKGHAVAAEIIMRWMRASDRSWYLSRWTEFPSHPSQQ